MALARVNVSSPLIAIENLANYQYWVNGGRLIPMRFIVNTVELTLTLPSVDLDQALEYCERVGYYERICRWAGDVLLVRSLEFVCMGWWQWIPKCRLLHCHCARPHWALDSSYSKLSRPRILGTNSYRFQCSYL